MIENLPIYIPLTFYLATALTVAFLLWAARRGQLGNKFLIALGVILAAELIVQAVLAVNGFYLVTDGLPPRFPLAPVPTTIFLLLIYALFAAKPDEKPFLQMLTLLSVARVPVELVLHWLFQAGQVPQLMTFEGRNFDILSGLSAPLVAWLAFRGGRMNKPLLVVWNLIALGLLVNIVTNAILSAPTPFQLQAFDQPNRAVLYFPYIWLPALIVPAVFVSHVWSLWILLRGRN